MPLTMPMATFQNGETREPNLIGGNSPTLPRKKTPVDEYFANASRRDIGAKMLQWAEDYYEHMRMSGRLYILQRSWEYYYQGQIRQARLRKTGKEDEYTTIGVNHYRNILRHLIIRTISQAVVYDPMAANTDHKSQAQTITAINILDYYNREKGMEDLTDRAVEVSVVLSEAYVSGEWDAQIGDPYGQDPSTGDMIKLGDIDFNLFSPFNVVYDFTENDPSKRDWIMTVCWVNKYDYAARYPELADRLVKVSADIPTWKKRNPGMFDWRDTNKIPRYRFYHAKTPAVPEGRFVEFFGSDLVTLEGPLPYDKIPVYRLAPEELMGTPYAYTVAFDLLPIQEAIDNLTSTILTNQATFGVQNIACPNGESFDIEEIVSGLNLVTYDPKFGKPEVLEMLKTPPEIFNFINMLVQVMETIAGINSVVRGNPEASLKSGAALALVASQAIEFNSGLQKSYAHVQRDLSTGVIEVLKQHADKPRLVTIAGKSNRSFIKEFTKDELSSVTRVTVNLGSPLSRTTAGKLQIADSLLEKGLIDNPDQYIQLATTGKLEPLYEGKQAEIMRIRAENEKLSDEKERPQMIQEQDPMTGQMIQKIKSTVPVLWTDNHPLDIKEHLTILASPEARSNPSISQNVLAHVQEHLTLWREADPTVLAVLGIPSIAPPPLPGGPSIGGPASSSSPGGAEGPIPAGPNSKKAAQVQDGRKEVMKKAEEVGMPNQPTNPLSGQPFNNQTGGL